MLSCYEPTSISLYCSPTCVPITLRYVPMVPSQGSLCTFAYHHRHISTDRGQPTRRTLPSPVLTPGYGATRKIQKLAARGVSLNDSDPRSFSPICCAICYIIWSSIWYPKSEQHVSYTIGYTMCYRRCYPISYLLFCGCRDCSHGGGWYWDVCSTMAGAGPEACAVQWRGQPADSAARGVLRGSRGHSALPARTGSRHHC
eukprot:2154785-Rhodomonas_salina.1